jgi:hypothetical protein
MYGYIYFLVVVVAMLAFTNYGITLYKKNRGLVNMARPYGVKQVDAYSVLQQHRIERTAASNCK